VRAMLDLALQAPDRPVSLKEISEREGLSAKYLDQIMTLLRHAGLIRAIRGARGGFQLDRDPNQVTVLDLVHAVEGRVAIVDCVLDPTLCDRSSDCVAREVWREVTEAIEQVLKGITLADLVRRTHRRGSLAHQPAGVPAAGPDSEGARPATPRDERRGPGGPARGPRRRPGRRA